ncbi:MAG: malate/lactate/ureidoglycolate dehydrogenase [Candidatus Competibacterales bacterium]
MIIQQQPLRTAIAAILARAGSEPAEATVVADHLVDANLAGHDSHGIGMIPYYLRFLAKGLLCPNASLRPLKDHGALLAFDGERGYGQRMAREAMALAIERVATTGVVLMTLRNAHHIGRIGAYGEQAVAAGKVSLHFVNVLDHAPMVAPFGGRDARFGTNPVCIAVPPGTHTPATILDMATSHIALGKVRVAMNKGETLAPGRLLDADGQPTTDPRVMFREPGGALLPTGEHKGYGLALMCELLAGGLSGGGTIQPANPRRGSIVNNMTTLVIDPAHLVDNDWLAREIDAAVAYAKASPPGDVAHPVMAAGDPERATATQRRATGIPVDDTTWEEILRGAEDLGMAREDVKALAEGA